MQSQLESRLQRDIEQIREKITEMSEFAITALKTTAQMLSEGNVQLAYSVILRDHLIDELEKELDRLCQDFLVRQIPVGRHLRFVYAVIKITNELERTGDYAESIARQFLSVSSMESIANFGKFIEIADVSIEMLHDAVTSFVTGDSDLAQATIKKEHLERRADTIRYGIHEELVQLREKHKLSLEALPPLMIIASRYERVADQASNICEETLFMVTGEDIKHIGKEVFRVLFVDEGDACRAQMAAAIGNSFGLQKFRFASAGVKPRPIDPKTVDFLRKKRIDISGQASKHLSQIPNIEHYQVIVALCEEAEEAFPPPPTKTVAIPWELDDPSTAKGSDEEIESAYEKAFQYFDKHIRELAEAIIGNEPD